MYLKANNGIVEKYPYSIGALRKENPNTSFPKKPSDAVLADYGVYPVRETNPTVGENQKLVKSWTPEMVDGGWILNHQVVDMTAEELAERDGVAASNMREERDKKLADTDFYALSDVTMPDAITAYRQALRDVPQQQGFPQEIIWPEKPE